MLYFVYYYIWIKTLFIYMNFYVWARTLYNPRWYYGRPHKRIQKWASKRTQTLSHKSFIFRHKWIIATDDFRANSVLYASVTNIFFTYHKHSVFIFSQISMTILKIKVVNLSWIISRMNFCQEKFLKHGIDNDS